MEKEYKDLAKKYALPAFKELDADFQVSTIESKQFILKEVSKKMIEKMEFFSGLLEDILSPERLSSLHESSMFDEEEKKKILRLYRKFHYIYRQNSILEIIYDEKETADFVKSFFDDWQIVKPDLKSIVEKVKNSWNGTKKSKLELSYFG